MKKLSFKWKLFLLACYLQLLVYGFLMIISSIAFFDTSNSYEDTFYFIATILSCTMIWLNNLLCIVTVHRYFPDSLLPAKRKKQIQVSGIINIVLFAVMFFLLISALLYIPSATDMPRSEQETNLFLIVILCFVWVSGVFPLILQFRMAGHLASNNSDKMDSLINSIGD